MASLADFAPHVAPFAPSCPTITVEIHLRAALAEFCAFVRCWRHVAIVNDLGPASRIVVPVPAGTVVHDIERAWHDDCELEARPLSDFDPRELAGKGSPSFITQIHPGEVSLVPRAESGRLRLAVFLKPSVAPSGKTMRPAGVFDPEVFDHVYSEAYAPVAGTLSVPDHILEQYGYAIGHGAVARALILPGQPWTDPAAAGVHRALFKTAMDEAHGINIRGQQRARVRQRPSYF